MAGHFTRVHPQCFLIKLFITLVVLLFLFVTFTPNSFLTENKHSSNGDSRSKIQQFEPPIERSDNFYQSNIHIQKFEKSDRRFVKACQSFWTVNNCQQLLFENRGDQHSWPNYLTSTNDLINLKQVLLVISFNFPNYRAALKTHTLYHRMFADVFYCGPGNNETAFWEAVSGQQNSPLSPERTVFLSYGRQLYMGGETFYYCSTLTYEKLKAMGNANGIGKLKGVLFMSDDVFFNVWMAKTLGKQLDTNWLMHDNDDHVFNVDTSKFCYGSRFSKFGGKCEDWRDWHGAKLYEKHDRQFYDEMVSKKNNGHKLWSDFFRNITKLTGATRRLLGNESGDMYYIAMPYLETTSRLFELFYKHHVFVETAVVSVLKAITPSKSLQLISTIGHDNGQGYLRDHPVCDVYNSRLEMMHPVKTGSLDLFATPLRKTNDKDERDVGCVYCNFLRLTTVYNDMLTNNINYTT